MQRRPCFARGAAAPRESGAWCRWVQAFGGQACPADRVHRTLDVALNRELQLRVRYLRDNPVAAFFIDLLLAVLAMAVLMLASAIGWVVLRGIEIGLGIGVLPELDDFIVAIAQPGVLALVLISMASTGGASLLLYWWRRRATADEISMSLAAARRASTWSWAAVTGVATYLASGAISALPQAWASSRNRATSRSSNRPSKPAPRC